MRIGAVPVPVNPLYGATTTPTSSKTAVRGWRSSTRSAQRRCVRRSCCSSTSSSCRRPPARRHAPRRRRVLALQLWLHRSPQGCRPPARDLLVTCETMYDTSSGSPIRTSRSRPRSSSMRTASATTSPFPTRPARRPSSWAVGRARTRSSRRSSGSAPVVLLGADALQRDARGRADGDFSSARLCALRRRAASRGGLAPLARQARPRDPRRRRLDRDAPDPPLEHR